MTAKRREREVGRSYAGRGFEQAILPEKNVKQFLVVKRKLARSEVGKLRESRTKVGCDFPAMAW